WDDWSWLGWVRGRRRDVCWELRSLLLLLGLKSLVSLFDHLLDLARVSLLGYKSVLFTNLLLKLILLDRCSELLFMTQVHDRHLLPLANSDPKALLEITIS